MGVSRPYVFGVVALPGLFALSKLGLQPPSLSFRRLGKDDPWL